MILSIVLLNLLYNLKQGSFLYFIHRDILWKLVAYNNLLIVYSMWYYYIHILCCEAYITLKTTKIII